MQNQYMELQYLSTPLTYTIGKIYLRLLRVAMIKNMQFLANGKNSGNSGTMLKSNYGKKDTMKSTD